MSVRPALMAIVGWTAAATACVGCATQTTPGSEPVRDGVKIEASMQESMQERTESPTPVAPDGPRVERSMVEPSRVEPAPRWHAITDLVRVDRASKLVEFDAVAVLETGFLEQFVCGVGTREHESLFAFAGKASEIHAALLFAGLEPGAPGGWRERAQPDGSVEISEFPPTGARLRIEVVLPDGMTRPIEWFTRASPLVERPATDPEPTLAQAFVFSGSRFVANRRTGAERYAADASGSIVGLVTFGDETVGYADLLSPSAEIEPQVWEAWSERMPKPGTRVRIRIGPEIEADLRGP